MQDDWSVPEHGANFTPLPGVPTIDDYDNEGPPLVQYRDWKPEDTKVVSGPIGPVKQYPGRRFRS